MHLLTHGRIKSKRAEKRARQADFDSLARDTQLEFARQDERERRVAAKGREAGLHEHPDNSEDRRLSAQDDGVEADLPPPYMHTVPSYEEAMRGETSSAAPGNTNSDGQRRRCGNGRERSDRHLDRQARRNERDSDRQVRRQERTSNRTRSSSSRSSGDWGGPGYMPMLGPRTLSGPQGLRLQNASGDEGLTCEGRKQRTNKFHRNGNFWTVLGAAI